VEKEIKCERIIRKARKDKKLKILNKQKQRIKKKNKF